MEKYFIMKDMAFNAMNEANLTTTERWILTILISYANNQKDVCFAGNKAIAEKSGVSEKTVKRAIATLSEKGFIEIEPFTHGEGKNKRRGGTFVLGKVKFPNVYRLITITIPEPPESKNESNESKKTEGRGKDDPTSHMEGRGKDDPTGRGKNDPTGRGNSVPHTINKSNNKKFNNNNLSNSLSNKPDKPAKSDTVVDERLRDEARTRAKQRNAGDVEAYANRILENWRKDGIRSLNELRKVEDQMANANRRRSNSRAHKPYEEKLPNWAQKKDKEKSKKKAENADKSATVNQDISRLMERLNDKTKNGKKNN